MARCEQGSSQTTGLAEEHSPRSGPGDQPPYLQSLTAPALRSGL